MSRQNLSWIAPSVTALVSAFAWGALIWLGLTGIESVRMQHVPGYPNPAQVKYYVTTPAVVFLLVFVGLAWRLLAPAQLARYRPFGTLVLVMSLIGLLPYMFFYTGGV
jgi:hypothetical protein